jgi:hypothetical protein
MLPSCTRGCGSFAFCAATLSSAYTRLIHRRRLRRGRLLGLRRRRLSDGRGLPRGAGGLLAAEHPPDDQAKQSAGNGEDDGVRSHM